MVFVGLLFVDYGVYTLLSTWRAASVVGGCFVLYVLSHLLILSRYNRYHATTPRGTAACTLPSVHNTTPLKSPIIQ
jgi:hypothetical protein